MGTGWFSSFGNGLSEYSWIDYKDVKKTVISK